MLGQKFSDDPQYIRFMRQEYRRMLSDAFPGSFDEDEQQGVDTASNSRGGHGYVDEHEEIAFKVFQRLRLRHIQLMTAEEEALDYNVHAGWLDEYSEPELPLAAGGEGAHLRSAKQSHGPREQDAPEPQNASELRGAKKPLIPRVRAYNLAVTDLFVEKAIAYLEDHARKYQSRGFVFSTAAVWVFGFGAVLGLAIMIGPVNWLPVFDQDSVTGPWDFAHKFSRSFTGFGMLVLLAAILLRHGKANLDQAERLMERRHALRQGRLFVHLNGGRLSIDEMDKAFNWNYTQSNAFGSMKDDAQAPWGALGKELAGHAHDIFKTGLQAVLKNAPKPGATDNK